MAQIQIRTTVETMTLIGGDEMAENLTSWFDNAKADDVAQINDPRGGPTWLQKRHVVRITVIGD
jgi:hypothetical protein